MLQPGTKIGDLYQRNMTQPYVLQRLADRTLWDGDYYGFEDATPWAVFEYR